MKQDFCYKALTVPSEPEKLPTFETSLQQYYFLHGKNRILRDTGDIEVIFVAFFLGFFMSTRNTGKFGSTEISSI